MMMIIIMFMLMIIQHPSIPFILPVRYRHCSFFCSFVTLFLCLGSTKVISNNDNNNNMDMEKEITTEQQQQQQQGQRHNATTTIVLLSIIMDLKCKFGCTVMRSLYWLLSSTMGLCVCEIYRPNFNGMIRFLFLFLFLL